MLLSAVLFFALMTEVLLLFMLGNWWHNVGAPIYLVITVLVLVACAWRSCLVLITFVLSGGIRSCFERARPGGAVKHSGIKALNTMLTETMVVLYLYSYAQVFLPIFYKLRTWISFRPWSNLAVRRVGPVIILVHGFVCNSGLWGPMFRHLREFGFSRVHAVSLDPFYRSMSKSIIEFESQLTKIIQREGAVGEVILIGHSMGGVLARVFQNRHPDRVLAAISIGAPHAGTDLARLVSTIDAGPARPDTRWLLEFNAAIAAERDIGQRPALNIWSDSDNIVFPQGNAALSSGVDRQLNGVGHLSLVFSNPALTLVSDFLRKLGNN